jgi:hypothetical protein
VNPLANDNVGKQDLIEANDLEDKSFFQEKKEVKQLSLMSETESRNSPSGIPENITSLCP